MLKALLKKQFLELVIPYTVDQKTGKRRSKGAITGYCALGVLIFVSVFAMFFGISDALSSVMVESSAAAGPKEWIYFAMCGIMTISVGIFGSVFNTYAALYKAKDNDLLLSMPIPPSKILLTRVISVVFLSAVFSAMVWLPCVIRYQMVKGPGAPGLISQIIMFVFVVLLVSVLTCGLGYLVALVASRVRNKSVVTVVLSMTVLLIYYYVSFKSNELLQELLLKADAIGKGIRSWGYPFYLMGMGCVGNLGALILFGLLSAVVFGLCCYVLSGSFIKLVTTNKGEKKTVYRETILKRSSADQALLMREYRHLLSSTVYMLNYGMGLVMIPVLTVLAALKRGDLLTMLAGLMEEAPFLKSSIALLAAAAVGMMLSMDCFTAPAVSLEGKHLWIVRSMPVSGWTVLKSKEKMHVCLNAAVGVPCTTILCLILKQSALTCLLMSGVTLVYCWLTADAGLWLNLKFPNLVWESETVPIKQSLPVAILMFGGWAVVFGFAGLGMAASLIMPLEVYLVITLTLGAGLTFLIRHWLKGRGTQIFESL
ncbi:MAG: hypothetical protein HUJ69_00360 [Lachnospiraceae bacterium]|nr:hypothetical protein [Lachnospiraceae bacterium]